MMAHLIMFQLLVSASDYILWGDLVLGRTRAVLACGGREALRAVECDGSHPSGSNDSFVNMS
jgi:hypothetical protein